MSSLRKKGLTYSHGRRLFFVWAVVWAALMTVVSAIGSITHQLISRDQDVFRKWSVFWGRSILFGIGIRVRTTQRHLLDRTQAYVFASNHQVALDIPVAGLAIPVPFGWVAKAELARIPFLGWAIRASPSVFIDRSNPRRSVESMQQAGQKIRDGLSVVIFPEGSRSHGAELTPFKRGAFMLAVEAGVPIVPLTILNAHDIFNEKTGLARPGVIELVFGEPISLDGMGRKDIPELIDKVRTAMMAELEPDMVSGTGVDTFSR